MSIASNRSGLGLFLPALFNPTVAAAVGLGVIGVGLYRLLADDEDEVAGDRPTASSEETDGCSEERREILAASVVETHVAREEAEQVGREDASEVSYSKDALDQSKELIRQAMSELGKRSAAARARKRVEVQA
ncbi:hypothetical protein [Pelagovum sp. HNIBRBA483]|uniref:hypothetical protein n=1 Tax=Pelagovum sp. HNIBRBA483 TaxID=3233341 RepID=UPI0034A4E4BC